MAEDNRNVLFWTLEFWNQSVCRTILSLKTWKKYLSQASLLFYDNSLVCGKTAFFFIWHSPCMLISTNFPLLWRHQSYRARTQCVLHSDLFLINCIEPILFSNKVTVWGIGGLQHNIWISREQESTHVTDRAHGIFTSKLFTSKTKYIASYR